MGATYKKFEKYCGDAHIVALLPLSSSPPDSTTTLSLSYLSLAVTPVSAHSSKPSAASHHTKPSQAKVLTGGGDLCEAQVDIPLSVSHSCV